MAEAIVSIVVGRLTDLLTEEARLLHKVRDEIELVVTELMRIKTFLRDADSRMDEDKIRILLAEVRELAYDAEHVVETFLVKAFSSPGKAMQWKNTWMFSGKIKDIQRNMSLLFNRFRDCNIKSTLETPESSDSTHVTPGKLKRFHTFTTVEPEIFVGFQEDVDRLVGHLVDESDKSYPLISICGMGGLGKTTLAQKIYNHSTIRTYFASLAWVSISQKWQAKQVLQRILICLIHERKEEILNMDDDKLVDNLQQIQQKKKCLIVLDDIWSNDAWDSIKVAFTVERSISKLMLTSRHIDVAEYVNPKGLIHRPKSLTADQSWELLQLKALPTRGDYNDIARDFERMEKFGREMLRNCAGLPLAIAILGGILVTKPALVEWEKVYYDSLSSLKKGKGLGENQQNELFDILVRSYNDLPPQLKPCFLYLGKFNEDEWIDAKTLYQLWIAEGMVLSSDKREGETMMQVAESYMGELVHKSMVQVRFDDSESSLTKFKSCSLHDLMRDLSLSLAKAEHFFEAIDLREGNDFHLPMFPNTRQLVVYCDRYYRSKKSNSYFVKIPNHQHYRSMLLMNVSTRRACTSLPPILGSHFANFRLLRVLALENVWLFRQTVSGSRFGTSIGRVIGSLIYLRYLSARNSYLIILPWIQKLVLLQTLKLDGHVDIPFPKKSIKTLGKLAHLRHLYLPNYWGCYRLEKNVKLRFNELSKLETIENFRTRLCEVKDLLKLTSLKRVTSLKRATLTLSSTSSLRYWALDLETTEQLCMIRQLFWNEEFNFEELTISGNFELGELFEQQQRLNTNASKAKSKLETWENFNPLFCEVKDLPELTSLHRLRLRVNNSCHNVEEMMKYLATLALSSTSSLRYWALDFGITDAGDDRNIIRQLFWNDKFNLEELSLNGKIPELGEIFEQQQQLNTNTHIHASLIRITSLKLLYSCLEKDPMPVLEKIPTLRDLELGVWAYVGKEMVCSAMGFPKLTRLELSWLDSLEKWRVEEGSMPILSELKIIGCYELEELPEGLVYLNSLGKLILTMPSEFCDRVRAVNGEQGPDFFKVAHVPDIDISYSLII